MENKTYEGWEIAKMIAKGGLKQGDKIKTIWQDQSENVCTENEIIIGANNGIYDTSTKLEMSTRILTNENYTYKIIEKPVSFDEAITSCKRIKYIYKDYPGSDEYMTVNEMLYHIANKIDDKDLTHLINDGEWYIEK